MRQKAATIPVTVIGGFLGAGKTTFLNHLLRSTTLRYAVLVNDFGEINVDASLIARHDGTTMALTNGCVCCSISGGFIETLCSFLDSGTPFDHIVIEASGVGSPWRLAEIALVDPAMHLNRVIVLADASRIVELLADLRVGDTVREQFEKCDVVLLTKSDLVDQAALDRAQAGIAAVRPGIRILTTARDAFPDLAELEEKPSTAKFSAEDVTEAAPDHEEDFRRWSYRRTGAFDRLRLAGAIADLPPELLRLKGLCRITGQSDACLFQMVGQTWSLSNEAMDTQVGRDDIHLIGIGTSELPPPNLLDQILDRALAPAAAW